MDAGIERFDVAVAPGFTARIEVHTDSARDPQFGTAGEFRPVVTSKHRRICPGPCARRSKLSDQVVASNAPLDEVTEEFTRGNRSDGVCGRAVAFVAFQ